MLCGRCYVTEIGNEREALCGVVHLFQLRNVCVIHICLHFNRCVIWQVLWGCLSEGNGGGGLRCIMHLLQLRGRLWVASNTLQTRPAECV